MLLVAVPGLEPPLSLSSCGGRRAATRRSFDKVHLLKQHDLDRQMAHIKTVRLPVPRRIRATDFWNGLAGSGSPPRPVGTPSCSDPSTMVGTAGGRRVDVLLRLWGPCRASEVGVAMRTHEMPAAAWLPGRRTGTAAPCSPRSKHPLRSSSREDRAALICVEHSTRRDSDRRAPDFQCRCRDGAPGCDQPRTCRRGPKPMLYVICIIHMSGNSTCHQL